MSKCITRNSDFLKKIVKARGQKRESIIDSASKDEIRALSEIAFNISKGNFKIPEPLLKKLVKHRHSIRKLSKKTLSHTVKRTLLKQKGGFLPLLVSPVLSALGIIVGRAISSQIGL